MQDWLLRLNRYFPIRYSVWLVCAVGLLLSAFTLVAFHVGLAFVLLFTLLLAVGARDVMQTRHSVLRNYPVIGHLRFLLEFIRPEMRQYFIEGDNEAAPFSRQQRSTRTDSDVGRRLPPWDRKPPLPGPTPPPPSSASCSLSYLPFFLSSSGLSVRCARRPLEQPRCQFRDPTD